MQSAIDNNLKIYQICRCCLAENIELKHMQSVYIETEEIKPKINLFDSFTKCSGINLVADSDEMTKSICQACETKLISSYTFRALCQSSDEVLRKQLNLLGEIKEEATSDLEQNIVYEEHQPYQFSQVYISHPGVTKTEKQKDTQQNDHKQLNCNQANKRNRNTTIRDLGASRDKRKKFNEKQDDQRTTFECLGCNLKFSTDFILKRHIKQKKHSPDKFHCPSCGLGHHKFSTLLDHFDLHKDEIGSNIKTFHPCFYCKNIFLRQSNLKNHDCSVLAPASLHNLNAGQTKLINKDTARLTVSISKRGPGEAKCVCKRCDFTFSSADELLCHQLSLCSKGQEYICNVCKKEFRTKSHLFSHNLNFHKEKTFICDQCGGQFATAPKLDKHLVTHRKERSFKCAVCQQGFKDAYGLEVHSRSHEDRKLQCDLCKKFYRSLGTIRLHMHMHIQDLKTFDCDFCTKKFSRKIDKIRHLSSHTGDHVKCPHCNKEYQTGAGMRMHIKKVHEGLRYDCYVCKQPMSTREQLYKHLFIHRGFKPYNCPVCGRAFVRKYRLKTHLKSHNMKYDEKVHGYIEKDPSIYKMIDSCVNKGDKKDVTELKVPVYFHSTDALPDANEQNFHNTINDYEAVF